MMEQSLQLTRHARHRAEQRAIPHSVIGLIVEYGESQDVGDGAQKYALSKTGMRHLRRDLGPEVPKNLERYRKAYVVAAEGSIVTVAFARRRLFH